MKKFLSPAFFTKAMASMEWRLIVFPFLIFLFIRIFLLIKVGTHFAPLESWASILGKGILFDIKIVAYLLPFGLVVSLLGLGFKSQISFRFSKVLVWVYFSALLVIAVSEVLFWNEFNRRFNFIAVDYLLYTHEVIDNIVESYPVGWVFTGIFLFSFLITRLIFRQKRDSKVEFQKKHVLAGWLAVSVGVFSLSLIRTPQEHAGNTYINELGKNGVYTFFEALKSNEIDFNSLYATLPSEEFREQIRVLRSNRTISREEKIQNGQRSLDKLFIRKPKNIVLVSIESLSAKFLGSYGSPEGMTLHLDRYVLPGSIKFNRFFATGTRTVKGLEALSLGFPPIPGQSIVRRPNNDHLRTLGELLSKEGISPVFIYGGYSYFDNMKEYFGSNHYEVFDRKDFPSDSIIFENAWGVADEVLFNNAISILNQKTQSKKPFFSHIMTTSNHRPYTYPNGRVNVNSPGGRSGAVKYTDYAVWKFLEDAKKESWFKDTLFIITADHCASIAGRTKLPVQDYWIPLFFYGPGIVKSGEVSEIYSQVDIPPTIMDLFGVQAKGFFFGRSVLEADKLEPRALISNYQEVGYYKNNVLIELAPNKRVQAFRVDPNTLESTSIQVPEDLKKEAIAIYQKATLDWDSGKLKLSAFHGPDKSL